MTTNRRTISIAEFAEQLSCQLTEQLEKIDSEFQPLLQQTMQGIEVLKKTMHELRTFSCSYQFQSTAEEIHFFKHIKPVFYSKLIYSLKLLHIETRRPTGCKKEEKQFLQKELQKLSIFFDSNIEFYQYYRTCATYLDEKYFLRGTDDFHLTLDPHYFTTDLTFSTGHDYKLAKLIAYEQLRTYLDDALTLHHQPAEAGATKLPKQILHWTGSKTALIELLYALQSSGVFNNGAADVKLIAACFQEAFNVELGNYYRTFQEIRIRKGSRTQFLEQLIKQVTKRMDETDELIRN